MLKRIQAVAGKKHTRMQGAVSVMGVDGKEMNEELFESRPEDSAGPRPRPLADRMRPNRLEEFVGQEHLLGQGKILREVLERRKPFSMIFWGPPGCGKTALAFLLARHMHCHWVAFSAVLSGVKEIREVIRDAGLQWSRNRRQTILFVDEIHRFNKAQQDAFLPHVENGRILLVGATTENPSFEINKALISRTRVLVLHPLGEAEIERIVCSALEDGERGLGSLGYRLEPEAVELLCKAVQGDARRALNALELSVTVHQEGKAEGERVLTVGHIREALQKKSLLYDKSGEEHYNLISAFIKSMRGSNPDAALYWMARILEGGEDPLFIVRRMVVFASEDVGNADPMALSMAVAAKDAVHFVGMPEAVLHLSQAATYLACAPKSNASYRAYQEAHRAAVEHGTLPTPLHLRNAPTGLMRNLGYGKDYQYPHDKPDGFVVEDYLPEEISGRTFYRPTDRGYEKKIKERLETWWALRTKKPKGPGR